MVYVFLVVTVRNSYYTRLYVYLNMQKLHFRVNIIARTEFFIISLLHGVTVHNIRNQYRCMPTYCSWDIAQHYIHTGVVGSASRT